MMPVDSPPSMSPRLEEWASGRFRATVEDADDDEDMEGYANNSPDGEWLGPGQDPDDNLGLGDEDLDLAEESEMDEGVLEEEEGEEWDARDRILEAFEQQIAALGARQFLV